MPVVTIVLPGQQQLAIIQLQGFSSGLQLQIGQPQIKIQGLQIAILQAEPAPCARFQTCHIQSSRQLIRNPARPLLLIQLKIHMTLLLMPGP